MNDENWLVTDNARDHVLFWRRQVLRFNHVGRYVNFYNDVLDEYAADPARVRELKVQFETANGKCERTVVSDSLRFMLPSGIKC